jgi:hypothetical protein
MSPSDRAEWFESYDCVRETTARNDIANSISAVAASPRFYGLSRSPNATMTATIGNFITESGVNPMDVLGFIGHGVFATDPSSHAKEAVGLELVDNDLIRTPVCTGFGDLLSICFLLDPRIKPDGSRAAVQPCLSSPVDVDGVQSEVVQIQGPDGPCYALPLQLSGAVAQTNQVLLTSAKVVFVAACDTGTTFTGWWNLNLNAAPGGRALVVPDIAAMSALPANQGLMSPGNVDIQQGALAWEKLVTSLGAGRNAQNAVNDATNAVAVFYRTITSWPNNQPLAQVIFKVEGNPNVCPKCSN